MPPNLALSSSAEIPACGYCHLPTGSGRPENANLTGLSPSYILAQLKAFQTGKRAPAKAGWAPSLYMAKVAASLDPTTAATAANYYSSQHPRSFVKVMETTTVPGFDESCFAYIPNGKPSVPLSAAIIEMPDNVDSFERRDPHTAYIAYVPPGSIARGKKLAEGNGVNTSAPCTACHGPMLGGGATLRSVATSPSSATLPGPPLAGSFATYLFRQLWGFQTGTRLSDPAEPMRSVAARLTEKDMIDVAAYAASLRP